VTFALSWLLREVPMRATTSAAMAEVGAEGAVAGATPTVRY